jgi:hypothetical protein
MCKINCVYISKLVPSTSPFTVNETNEAPFAVKEFDIIIFIYFSLCTSSELILFCNREN